MIEYYTTPEVLRILKTPQQTFQTCLKAALYRTGVRTRPRRFSFQDLIVLRTAKGLCDAGIPVPQIRRVLKSLKQQLTPEQELANLKIYADGKRVVVVDGAQRWQPDSGQFLLNFGAQELHVRSMPAAPQKIAVGDQLTAQDWFEKALRLEEESVDQARQAYRETLRLDPSMVDAHINLGFLHHQAGEWDDAEQHYLEACRWAPEEVLGYFNLAVLYEDKGDRRSAIASYQQVLEREANYADAHHNLARLYEAEGQRTDAIRHYAAAKRLLKSPSKQG
jgi:tetratricopeptide (TPR) repeat protein